jgi:hypothetical protein
MISVDLEYTIKIKTFFLDSQCHSCRGLFQCGWSRKEQVWAGGVTDCEGEDRT